MTMTAHPKFADPVTPASPAAPPGRKPARAVEIECLNAFYGDRHAIKNLSLGFEPNKATALIGPSGSGKSTVVRCINRMHEEQPGARTYGQVLLDGDDVYGDGVDVVAVRRAIGMVFQKPNPFPTMSIFDNVASGLRLTSRKVDGDRVEGALRGAGLWEEVKDRLHSPGIGLSGGQQQRLCIARALAVEPEVILMDEPCSALDPTSTRWGEEAIAAARRASARSDAGRRESHSLGVGNQTLSIVFGACRSSARSSSPVRTSRATSSK